MMTLMSPNNDVKRMMDDLRFSIIHPNNPHSIVIIKDLIMDNLNNNKFDVSEVILDIEIYNRHFFREIAQIAMETGCLNTIYEEFDYIETLDDAEDCVYEWYFPDNSVGGALDYIENMVYESVTHYGLPVILTRDAADEYPIFLRRFSNANGYYIDSLPYEKEINLHAAHAQQIMFEELIEDGCASFGRNNVLLLSEEKKKDNSGAFLEEGR